jgi:sugar lactone lactonase YvrE
MDGIITTVAGTGEAEESSGDDGPAAEASFTRPFDVVVDSAGNIYVADVFRARGSEDDIPSNRIRKIDTEGTITTIAGGEACGYTGDGGPAEDAELCFPRELVVGTDGTIFLTDPRHHQIRMIAPDGVIHSLPVFVEDPSALALGPDGALYVGDGDRGRVHRIPLEESPGSDRSDAPDTPDSPDEAPDLWADAVPHVAEVVAGTGAAGSSGDDGPAVDAQLSTPDDLAVGQDGTLYVLDSSERLVRAIHPDGTITTVAGGGSDTLDSVRLGPMTGDGRRANEVRLGIVTGIDVAADGTLFLADWGNRRVRKVNPAGVISTFAGTGQVTAEYDPAAVGGPATHMAFGAPSDVAVARDGTLYVSDAYAHRVFRIGLDGTIQVAAGTGTAGFSGDGGPATEAELERPSSIDVAADGTLYIVDDQSRIRVVGTDGAITTVAGKDSSEYGDPVEGVPATEVYLVIRDVSVDDAGTIYLSSFGSIRAIDTDGIISTLAPADTHVTAVAVDGAGSLYFSQPNSHQVSVLPKFDEEIAPVAAEDDESDSSSLAAMVGVALAVGVVVGYLLLRRRRSARSDSS